MKIIRVETYGDITSAALAADSAWRPHRRPLFVPDDTITGDRSVYCEIRVALRIDRLGKNIAERFAERYIGAVGLVNRMWWGDGDSVEVSIMDDALIHGEWLDIPADNHLRFTVDGSPVDYTYPREDAARLLAQLSAAGTFKTGDVIILPGALHSYTPAIDSQILVSTADGTSILEFSIK